jgi:hypothetical protein
MSRHQSRHLAGPFSATSEHGAFSRSRLKTGPAAPLTLHFLVTLFEKTFAFAILAFHFPFACVLLHVLSKSNTDAYNQARENAIRQNSLQSLGQFLLLGCKWPSF